MDTRRIDDTVQAAGDAINAAASATADDVERARLMLYASERIRDHLVPDVANLRRAAVTFARSRMSAEELAGALGISRARVYAIINGG